MSMIPMVAGTTVAGRFVIERAAGSGGMGTVFRAMDTFTGKSVALKLLHFISNSAQGATRLVHEAQVLAELRHPGIVSYVAHGQTPSGQPFLAMEWLEGEDLAQRLRRQRLSLRETLALVRGAAAALAAAHRRGIVHRDIKPSNLLLRGGQPEQVALLDFGIARQLLPSHVLTQTEVGLDGHPFCRHRRAALFAAGLT